MDEELHGELVRLIKRKFAGYPNVASLADDIVGDAYIRLRSSKKQVPSRSPHLLFKVTFAYVNEEEIS